MEEEGGRPGTEIFLIHTSYLLCLEHCCVSVSLFPYFFGQFELMRMWIVKQIVAGDVLCDIETDKATLDFESLEDG